MKSCSVHHSVLFLFILIPVADLTVPSVTSKLHHPVTLTCKHKCSGEMRWKMFNTPDILAQCDQYSCRSEEGFEIPHDQYLKGNLDLVIRSADYSKRTFYTCYCDDKVVCDVRLNIEPLVSQVQKKPGEDLVLDLPLSEPMEVDYKRKDSSDLYGERICRVIYGLLECGDDYKQRTSLRHTEFTLLDLKESDSGVYIVRDMKRNEVLHTYLVSVEEYHPRPVKTPQRSVPDWSIVAVGLLLVLVFSLTGIILYMWKNKMTYGNKSLNESLLDGVEVQSPGQRSISHERISQLMKFITMVDLLIQEYETEERSVRSWPKSDFTSEQRKKSEMEELIYIWNREKPELNELGEPSSIQESELDDIIKKRRRERSDGSVAYQRRLASVPATWSYLIGKRLEGPQMTRSDESWKHREAVSSPLVRKKKMKPN